MASISLDFSVFCSTFIIIQFKYFLISFFISFWPMTLIEVCSLFPKWVVFSLTLLLTSNLTALWAKHMAKERNSWTSVDLFHDTRHGFISGLSVFLFVCWAPCLIDGHYTSLLILLLKSFLSKTNLSSPDF